MISWSVDSHPGSGSSDVVSLDHASSSSSVFTDMNVVTGAEAGYAIVSASISNAAVTPAVCVVTVKAAS